MTKFYVSKLSESTLRVTSDDFGAEQEMSEFFSFRPNGYQFVPSFKAKIWDGFVRMYDIHRKTIAYGLLSYVRKFAEMNDYEIVEDGLTQYDQVSMEDVSEFVDALHLHVGGKKIAMRDYQLESVCRAINTGRMIARAPTSSGKSAIIYAYVRWQLLHNRRVILVVPTTGLVTQMIADFADYASETSWDVNEHCHALYGGQEKDFSKPVLVTTWQSVHAMSKTKSKAIDDFYKSWDVYIGDECHRFASASLQTISNRLSNASYRLGTTGTVQDDKVAKLNLEGSFGAIYNVISTKELMDAGQVVDLKIKCLMLDYDAETKQLLAKADYVQEMNYIVTSDKRNKFVANLARATKGNTLVLFNFVSKQGKPLFELLKKLSPDRPVFYVSGETSVDERERIRLVLSTHDDAILVASYATLSTGTNIPSIENIIFASPSKGKIRNLQSIGRGLRLKEGKSSCTLYDISDNFAKGSKMNHTLRHFKERMETYQAEQFKFDLKTIPFNASISTSLE